jgi:hypothetical protein
LLELVGEIVLLLRVAFPPGNADPLSDQFLTAARTLELAQKARCLYLARDPAQPARD